MATSSPLATFERSCLKTRGDMNFDQYQVLALRTVNMDLSVRDRVANGAMGLCGEAGETADVIKKNLYHDHPLDVDAVKKELGDVLWYAATLAHEVGLSMNDIAEANIDKLIERYPDGFSAERSMNRKLMEGEELATGDFARTRDDKRDS